MASSSSRTKSSGPVLRSLSPSSRFCSYTTSKTPFSSPSSAFASSTSSGFSSSTFFNQPRQHHSQSHHSHHRAASPTRVNLYSPAPLSSGVRFSIDPRSISPNRSISNQIITTKNNRPISGQKKTCMCSPTMHPGSFRCSLHKNIGNNNHHSDSYPSNRLNMRRSAMKNSLVRIGGVEGEWVKRALTALIRPSSHQQRRRAGFEPRPTSSNLLYFPSVNGRRLHLACGWFRSVIWDRSITRDAVTISVTFVQLLCVWCQLFICGDVIM
uniref:Serine-rich protein n=1 Tax=Glycine max TaxID=3847 RepID=A0A0R0K8U2_SOYBN